PFVLRVKWVLELKGIQYQYVEDLGNKSAMLLQYNPVHKKLPALVHDGKPLAESLVILEYIDETWKQDPSLLPHDPYEKANAILRESDIAIGWLGYWVRIVEEIVGVNLINEELMAKLDAWFDNFLELPVINECMSPRDKLLNHNKAFHKLLTSSST
ncbi:hypothetical protein GLYMA_06G099000v4, partial [Glycine max]